MCAGMWISPFRKILIVPGRAGSMQGISAQLGSTGFVLLCVYVERFSFSARCGCNPFTVREAERLCLPLG